MTEPPYKVAKDIIHFDHHPKPKLSPRWPIVKTMHREVWPGHATMHVVADREPDDWTQGDDEVFWGAMTFYGEEKGPDPGQPLQWRRMQKVVEVTYKDMPING